MDPFKDPCHTVEEADGSVHLPPHPWSLVYVTEVGLGHTMAFCLASDNKGMGQRGGDSSGGGDGGGGDEAKSQVGGIARANDCVDNWLN